MNSNNTSTKKILFVTYGGGHVNMMIPLIRYLEGYPEYQVEVLALTTAGPALDREGIPHLGMRHFVDDQDAEALEWGKRLAQGMPTGKVLAEETVAYLGLSYMDLIERYGEKEAGEMYANLGRQTFCPLTVLERILKKVEPDLVVATNSPRAEKAAILSARSLNIPSICLVDLFALWEVERIKDPQYADKVCVLSEYVKNIIVEAGRDSQDIIVTGNPAFDHLADTNLEEKGKQVRAQKGWGTDKVILWASQAQPETHPITGEPGDPDLSRKVDHEFFKLIEKHPDWRLVIRLHPSENFQYDRLPDRVEFSPLSEDLPSLLKAVDVVVSLTSTVGLQGVLLGIPYVILNISVYSQDAPFSKLGLAYGVDRLEDLESGLVQVLNEGWQPTVPLPEIGRATQNVVQVIENQLAQINRPLPG